MTKTYWDVRVLLECPQDECERGAQMVCVNQAFMLEMRDGQRRGWVPGVRVTDVLLDGRYVIAIEVAIQADSVSTAITALGDQIRAALDTDYAGIFEVSAHRIGDTG